MSESTPPRAPGPEDARDPAASVSDDQPTTPQPQPGQDPFPRTPAAAGPHSQAAFSYPAAPPAAPTGSRRGGRRVALIIAGSIVAGLLLFGGGYLTASVVDSIPGTSDGRFGDGGPRLGPGGGRMDDGGPRTRDNGSDDDSGSDGSTDPSVFLG